MCEPMVGAKVEVALTKWDVSFLCIRDAMCWENDR